MSALSSATRIVYRTRFGPKGRAILMLSLVMAMGAALSLLNVPLASSAANAVEVMHTDQAVPMDPQSPLWNKAKEATIPLSSQQIYQPGGGSTRSVFVRSLEDGHSIGFRVTWDDDTKNDTTGNVPTDAAAVQLPMDP